MNAQPALLKKAAADGQMSALADLDSCSSIGDVRWLHATSAANASCYEAKTYRRVFIDAYTGVLAGRL